MTIFDYPAKPTSENPDPSARSGQAVGHPAKVGPFGFATVFGSPTVFKKNLRFLIYSLYLNK